MASIRQSIRSSTASKRPTSAIADGQIALNTASGTPGMFFKDSAGNIIKTGPAHYGASAPNSSPAVGGSTGNSIGEAWLDSSLTPAGWKIWNGSAWVNATPLSSDTVQGLVELATNAETQTGADTARAVTSAGLQSKVSDSISTASSSGIASSSAVKTAYDLANAALPKSGGIITGNLEIGSTGSLTFEGSTADGFETTLAVVDPTLDRTITFPNITGTVVTTGDTGTVTSTMILDGTIVDADINASAEIAVSKLADGAARQLLQTDAAGTGVEWASNIDIPGTLDVTSAATFDSTVAVTGALTKSGNNVVTVGDTGTVTSTMILDGTILNADVNASAAIAGTKISPDFGAQTIVTTGVHSAAAGSAAAPSMTFTGDLNTGIYSPGADQVAISTNGTGRVLIGSAGAITQTLAAASNNGFAINNGTDDLIAIGTGGFAANGGSVTDGGIRTTNNLVFATGSGAPERLRITSAGLVGVGTSSPSTLLHLSSSSSEYLRIQNTTAGNSVYLGNSAGTGILQVDGANSLKVITNSSDRLVVTSAGLVGVGTTSPSGNLHVVGVSGTSIIRAVGADAEGNADVEIFSTGSTGNSRLYFSDTAAQSGSIIYNHNTNSLVLGTAGSERARITSAGLVGIGTSSPGFKLDVNGEVAFSPNTAGKNTFYFTTNASNDASLFLKSDTTNKVNIQANGTSYFNGGNVGIGTSTFADNNALLHVSKDASGSTGGSIVIRNGAANASGNMVELVFKTSSGFSNGFNSAKIAAIQPSASETADLAFYTYGATTGTERLRITAAGLVGIGTTSPNSALHVVGNQFLTGGNYFTDATSGYFFNGSGGFAGGIFGSNSGNIANIVSPQTITLSTASSERARLDSSGRLLVGTSTSTGAYYDAVSDWQGRFQVARSDQNAVASFSTWNSTASTYTNYGGAQLHFSACKSGTVGTHTSGALTSGDTVGSITFSPSDGTNFRNCARIEAVVDGGVSTDDVPGRLVFSTTADGSASPTERMRINNSGLILVGTTSTTGLSTGSSVNQGVTIGAGIVSSQRNDTTNNTWAKATGYTSGDFTAHYVNNTYVGGISTNGSTTTYATASDYRLKENIVPVTGSIVRFQQLKPRRFNFIGHSQSTVDGFLAHEVQQIVPEAVVGEKDATNEDGTIKPQGIDQSKLVPLLTAALQEAIAKIEILEARLTAAGIE